MGVSHLSNAGNIPEGISPRVAVVAAEFNGNITQMLHQSSIQTLTNRGIKPEHIDVHWIPGAFEIPLMCQKILAKNETDGIITLGAVIRGDTPHFDYVAGNCARGVLEVSLKFGKPIIFGVLTTDTLEQALSRADLKRGNKGSEAAHSLLNLLVLYHKADL